MNRYFIDTEFVDTGSIIDLISIGIVSSDGREYYAQSCEFDPRNTRKSPWLEANVLPHLTLCRHVHVRGEHSAYVDQAVHDRGQCVDQQRGYLHDCPWRTRRQIMHEVARFFDPGDNHEHFELIGWCAGYDFVVLCQLFGTMMDIPATWPHYIKDLQFVLDALGISDEALATEVPSMGTAHRAIDDARYLKRAWEAVDPLTRPLRYAATGPVNIGGEVKNTLIITGEGNQIKLTREEKEHNR